MKKYPLDEPINAESRYLHGVNVRLDELLVMVSELVKTLSGKATEAQVAEAIQEKAHEILVQETKEYHVRQEQIKKRKK